jgi:uncharacterized protein YjiS (DUF1127 family)
MSAADSNRCPSWYERIRVWAERARGRRALARLDDAALKDLGISRVDAWREVNKPFWRA